MHKPVLLDEVLNFLDIQKEKIYVDCTVGAGGHSLEILKRLNGNGILIGIEKDEDALKIAKEKLKEFNNCYLFHTNFLELRTILSKLKIKDISGGVLLDLGVSSMQLDCPERGFSFQSQGPLDMRMDTRESFTAFNIINSYREDELAEIIFKYGEERLSRKIAKNIVLQRQKGSIPRTTLELAKLILNCYPKNKWFKTHPATKTFQAIRIEVNKELETLEKFLCFIPELLTSQGRLIVISFHSLEDRITKHFLKTSKEFKILTKKPLVASRDEIKDNPRARSAKLRAAEKIK